MHNRKIAKRYAKAFFLDGIDTDKIDRMTGEVRSLVAAIGEDGQIRKFFTSPVIPKSAKLTVVKNLAEKFEFLPSTLSLMELLIKHDRMDIIGDVFEEFQSISDRIHERIRVKITTAYEPSKDELEDISRRIGNYFGRKAIVERFIDRDIIGGFILESEDKLIDMSIRGQIQRALSDI